jgi:hypothetical protein
VRARSADESVVDAAEPADVLEPVVTPQPAASRAAAPAPPAHAGRARHWWMAGMALVAGVVVLSLWPSEPVPEGEAAQATTPEAAAEEKAPAPMLTLGMTPEEVVAIEGEPLRRGEDRWEYGPSWVRFEQGQVVDWHSSPLRALRVSSARPRP